MPWYREVSLKRGRHSAGQYTLRTFQQSRLRHWIAVSYSRWAIVTGPFLGLVESWLERRHDTGCRCPSGYHKDGRIEQICLYVPLRVRQDLRAFHYAHAQRGPSLEVPISPEWARLLGWRTAPTIYSSPPPPSSFGDDHRDDQRDDGEDGQPHQSLDHEPHHGEQKPHDDQDADECHDDVIDAAS